MRKRTSTFSYRALVVGVSFVGAIVVLASCGGTNQVTTAPRQTTPEAQSEVNVGVVKVSKHPLQRQLTLSSELVPFQEIDVYAKESGYVSKLLVDYGSHVKAGQLMAVLEIPELQATVQQDEAAVKSMGDQVTNAQNQLGRVEAQHKVLHLEYQRINSVAESKPGLVAQQEVDEVQGRDLASEAQIESSKSALSAAQSNLAMSRAKLQHDQAIYAYSHISAPFAGVVTQRFANQGTLMQAGTASSTQAMPLVKLSEEDLFRLVIPVPESYVGYIRLGDPVHVHVPALDKIVLGKVARFSYEVRDETRTMHTEVDVPNPKGILFPGVYAEATLTLNRTGDVLTVPVGAIDREGNQASVLVVNPSNKIELRHVTLGIETANSVEVESGLQEGDQLVVSDRSGLKPGEQVHPQLTSPETVPSSENS